MVDTPGCIHGKYVMYIYIYKYVMYIYICMHKIYMHVCCRYMVDIYNMSTFLSALFLILFVLAALHMTFRHA